MKKLIVFILLLALSKTAVFPCSYYPYGEGVRMHFLDMNHFNCYSFNEFEYSSQSFYPKEVYRSTETGPNTQLWYEYCEEKVPVNDIEEAVYGIESSGFNKQNSNKMIQYLIQKNDSNAINYLLFAKSCEKGNMFYTDPWEKNKGLPKDVILQKINTAIELGNKSSDESLSLRYKFLAIRLAYYANNNEKLIQVFNSIASVSKKNIIHHWARYFRTRVENDKSLQSFYAAQVFANAPEKRFAIYRLFDTKINVNSIIKHAKNKEEIANIYGISAILKHDRSIDLIQKAIENGLSSDYQNFLLLREVNKIEDWVFTPYYTYFEPSIDNQYWYQVDDYSYQLLENRINKDRQYAKTVLDYLDKLNSTSVEIEVIKAQLSFISKDYEYCKTIIEKLNKKLIKSDSLYSDFQIIKSLREVACQSHGEAVIPETIKSSLFNNQNNQRFLFAIGRELEYLGNTEDAALLYSKSDYELSWKSKHHLKYSYQDYFSNYFEYIDVIYIPEQLVSVIERVEQVDSAQSNPFELWLTGSLIDEKELLLDLLGTKYIRQNNLVKAAKTFGEIDSMYWNNNYSLWNEEWHSIGKIFDQNPFYTLKYTPDFIAEKENFYLTKLSVTNKLIEYLERANNPAEKDRDLYYFLVANCYKNMAIKGNSWMMRRFGVSDYDVEPFPEDEEEFQQGILAKAYYKKASKFAKNSKFKLLCLWLAKEENTIENLYGSHKDYEKISNNNCYAFEEFFEARR